jgi:hypothetical protein
MIYGDSYRPKGSNWVIGFVVTALLHGGIFFGIIILRFLDAKADTHAPILNGQVVDVQAVKFGKPRDLSFLPHKERVALNKGPKPKIQLTENDQALPHLKDPNEKAPDVEDPLKTTHSKLFENVTDPEQAGVEEEGDPHGIKGGNALVGKGPIYLQNLQAAVQNAWTVPTTISDDKLAKLKAMACMSIDAAGKLGDIKIKTPSGDDTFDATLLGALNSIKDFPPPTDDVKALVANGVCMNFNFQKTR